MSSHNDFWKDIYTTLPGSITLFSHLLANTIILDDDDRLLSTVVTASWKLYNTGMEHGAVYNAIYNSAIRGIMDEFFGPAEEGKACFIISTS